jgi:predicted carbohydrate-binding protein with CBM5 and CBM33 domain
MLRNRIRRAFGIGVLGLVPLILPVAFAGVANAHGYTNNPPSRSYHCKLGNVSNCGASEWEPQSVEGPKGFPSRGPSDGQLCSGSNSRFAQLDDQSKAWPKTTLTSGQQFEFVWTLTAAHATSKFHYYMTKDGWNPNQPLSRSQLELTPFLTVPFDGQRPPFTVRHSGTLPAGNSGHHMIYAVWDVADTTNAFYSCSDINFR